jgi:hypothetical protein
MSQSLPVARIRLVKIEVRAQPPISVPGSRLPAAFPEPALEPLQGTDPRLRLAATGA